MIGLSVRSGCSGEYTDSVELRLGLYLCGRRRSRNRSYPMPILHSNYRDITTSSTANILDEVKFAGVNITPSNL